MNMAYCRFQNTAIDLEDCKNWLEDNKTKDLSFEEQRAYRDLLESCKQIIELDEEQNS